MSKIYNVLVYYYISKNKLLLQPISRTMRLANNVQIDLLIHRMT